MSVTHRLYETMRVLGTPSPMNVWLLDINCEHYAYVSLCNAEGCCNINWGHYLSFHEGFPPILNFGQHCGKDSQWRWQLQTPC